ncbi:MAG: carbon-nitrogen family hydrolase [Anaerolineales bacterium]|nr:carbon-nitrogen family hydrolase [Anaerolineales bacterium]
MKLRIALGQMDVALGQPELNLARVAQMAATAAAQGAELLVLPELWSTGYDLAHAEEHAAALDAGVFAATAVLTRDHRLAIVGSCLADLGAGRVGNTAVLWDAGGQIRASYTKTHLFGLMQEDRYLTPGDALALVDAPWGATGLAICYDLRFPELFRRYALDGARLILLPSEWPYPRLAHWQTLLRARAIENQLFVVGCNRVGRDAANEFFGHSCIVDPWGETVLALGETPGVETAVIDLALVDEVRGRIPVFADRRPTLYAPD